MYYYNLVEDEQEARREKLWNRTAILLVLFGIIYFWYNLRKKNT